MATAFLAIAKQLIAQLTGRSLAQVQADIDAWTASGVAPAAWTLATQVGTRVVLDRVAPITREESPMVAVRVAAATITAQSLADDPDGQSRADLDITLEIQTRGDPLSVALDAVLVAVQARIWTDLSLGGLVGDLQLASLGWSGESADKTVGQLDCVWRATSMVQNATLE